MTQPQFLCHTCKLRVINNLRISLCNVVNYIDGNSRLGAEWPILWINWLEDRHHCGQINIEPLTGYAYTQGLRACLIPASIKREDRYFGTDTSRYACQPN